MGEHFLTNLQRLVWRLAHMAAAASNVARRFVHRSNAYGLLPRLADRLPQATCIREATRLAAPSFLIALHATVARRGTMMNERERDAAWPRAGSPPRRAGAIPLAELGPPPPPRTGGVRRVATIARFRIYTWSVGSLPPKSLVALTMAGAKTLFV